MKKTMQGISVVLALAATVQVIQAYAADSKKLSVETEEYKITKLIDLKREIDLFQDQDSVLNDPNVQFEFPQLQTEADLRQQLAKQALRYLQSIGAEDALRIELSKPENKYIYGSEPGI